MTAYILDTDYYTLRRYEEIISTLNIKVDAKYFTNTNTIWDAFKSEVPDVVFVEKEAYGACGLIEKIRERDSEQKIVLVSSGNKLTPELLNQQLSGFVQKPLTSEILEKQFFKIRHPFLVKIFDKQEKDKYDY